MLLDVLSFVDLAGGIISFTHATYIRHSCGAQNTVAAHSLWKDMPLHFMVVGLCSSSTILLEDDSFTDEVLTSQQLISHGSERSDSIMCNWFTRVITLNISFKKMSKPTP